MLEESELTPESTPEPINKQKTVLANGVIEANNLFAIDLYNNYKSEGGNIFFSPYSISSALTMAYEGAMGNTAKEMQTALYLPDDKQKIHSDFVEINNNLNKTNKNYKLSVTNSLWVRINNILNKKNYELSVANALWLQKDYTLINSYVDIVDTYYGGKVANLDFKKDTENSRITINKWIEDKTNNKIKDLIPKGILLPDTRLVLTNAIYFKANWSNKFDTKDTIDGQFKLSSGINITAKMMNQVNYFNYGKTDDIQILEMDYLGNDLSMLVILPKENNLNKVENIFSEEKLNEWKNNMQKNRVAVTLPKFNFETKYFMAEDLKKIGIKTAFSYPDANFTGISPATTGSPNGELHISEVIHQAFIEVEEQGTEAAAATAVPMMMEVSTLKPFIADHPFIFIIQQKGSGNILFIGRMSNPSI